jgi:hypothetical protein
MHNLFVTILARLSKRKTPHQVLTEEGEPQPGILLMDGSQRFGRNINRYTWFWGVFCLRNGEAITKVGEEGICSIGAERAHIRCATP